ncbi:hypothetical protein YB2330_003191 [Saitoella coloradoensis]
MPPSSGFLTLHPQNWRQPAHPSALLAEAKPLIESVPQWTHVKTYTSTQGHFSAATEATPVLVEGYKKKYAGLWWYARQSIHTDITFDEFKSTLFEDHAENEASYIPTITSTEYLGEGPYTPTSQSDECDSWTTHLNTYTFPAPLSKRDFMVTIYPMAISPTQFIVISIPTSNISTQMPPEPGTVRGAYTSIERVRVLPDDTVEWTMCTTSDARGILPCWMQRLAMPGEIVKDVGLWMDWTIARRERSSMSSNNRCPSPDSNDGYETDSA